MQLTGIVVAVFGAIESVAVPCDTAIQGPPQKHAARKIQQRHCPPESSQPEREIADRLGAPVPVAAYVNDAHFFHQPIVGQIGPALGDFGIVQRQVRQPCLAIPPRQLANLRRANAAVAIVDDDVDVGTLVRSWQEHGKGKCVR